MFPLCCFQRKWGTVRLVFFCCPNNQELNLNLFYPKKCSTTELKSDVTNLSPPLYSVHRELTFVSIEKNYFTWLFDETHKITTMIVSFF